MEGNLPVVERFKTAWTGTDRIGRRAYVTPVTTTDFLGYGVHEPSGRLLFTVLGSLKEDFWVFIQQMASAGAKVTICYGPKVASEDKGELVRSCAALEEAWRSPPVDDQIGLTTPKGP